jgi:ubiquinone/menaquinone biosynthesis C-methylase UbiE
MALTDQVHEQVDVDKLMKDQMEKVAPSYDTYMKRITLGREHVLRETTVKLAQVKPGDSVLEVGCGTGTLTLESKRQAGPTGKVYGIDIIPRMIELSQRKAALVNEEITFQQGGIDAIPFSENQFDVVMCSFMIFHMSENTRCKGMTEIYRVLKPQGRLLILDLALPTQPVQKAIAGRLFGSWLQDDPRELLPVMEAAGFTGVESGQAPFRVMGLSLIGYVRGNARKG